MIWLPDRKDPALPDRTNSPANLLDLDELGLTELLPLASAWGLDRMYLWSRFLEEHLDSAVSTLRDLLESHHAEYRLAGANVPSAVRATSRSTRLSAALDLHGKHVAAQVERSLRSQITTVYGRWLLVETDGDGPTYSLHATADAAYYHHHGEKLEGSERMLGAVIDLGPNPQPAL